MLSSEDLAESIVCRKWYEMELEHLNLAERSGDLVPVSVVRRYLEGHASAISSEISARFGGRET